MNPQITLIETARREENGAPRCRRGGCTETNPNEANGVKYSLMSEMCQKFMKRSQMTYRSFFQWVGSILGPFFGKRESVPSMNGFKDGRKAAADFGAKLECDLESISSELRLSQPSMNWNSLGSREQRGRGACSMVKTEPPPKIEEDRHKREKISLPNWVLSY